MNIMIIIPAIVIVKKRGVRRMNIHQNRFEIRKRLIHTEKNVVTV